MAAARLRSVHLGRDQTLLPSLFRHYAPAARVVRDVTANRRRMWSGVVLPGVDVRWYDADPSMRPDVVCRWSSLPDADGSVDVLVYDPPHLPPAAASARSDRQMAADYGLAVSLAGRPDAHDAFLAEAVRVLADDGLIFAKIKDHVHDHRYRWASLDFVMAVRAHGLTACDHIVKVDPCGGNLSSGRWRASHHARCAHCSWIIVRKGRCEPRRRSGPAGGSLPSRRTRRS